MEKIIELDINPIRVESTATPDYNDVLSDGSYATKVKHFVPQQLVEKLNQVIRNLNEITESNLGRSIMNLEKGSDDK